MSQLDFICVVEVDADTDAELINAADTKIPRLQRVIPLILEEHNSDTTHVLSMVAFGPIVGYSSKSGYVAAHEVTF